MAEARSAVSRPAVPKLEEGRDTVHDVTLAWRKSILRRFYRTRNSIRNGMWPTSIYNLAVTIGLSSILLVGDWPWAQPITSRLWKLENFLHLHKGFPFYLRVVILSWCFGVLFFLLLMYIRRYLLRMLLSYQGWLYERPKSQSLRTLLWGLLVKLISGYSPSLYSCQASLPKMPVPPVRDTLVGLIESLKPLYGPESPKIEELKKQSKEFEKKLGTKLQKILVLKSWWSQNYVTDWWNRYIYLIGRTPLLNNSNYYVMDHSYWKATTFQCARAACIVNQLVDMKRMVDREQLPPLLIRNTIPICMSQYEWAFSTTRTPHLELDELKHFDPTVSKHIVVLRKGHFYKLSMYDSRGELVPSNILERQFEWIVEDAECHEISQSASRLPALTAWDRVNWAKTRSAFFSAGVNKDFLDTVESAILFVTLDTVTPQGFVQRGKLGLHGNGANLWADKSIGVVAFADGRVTMNAEHTWGDAPVLGHFLEYAMTNELTAGKCYDEEGHCLERNMVQQGALSHPQRLIWEMPDVLRTAIETAYKFSCTNNADLDLAVTDFRDYGKGFIKNCRVSPDAYVQVALQMAYYRMHGKFALTYESTMTRLYVCGRTETVRSLTQESVDCVLAMTVNSVDRGLKIRLLRRACDRHQALYRDAMSARGTDRHLFALYVIGKGLGYDSEFLQSTLSLPWTLSTSQQPQQQIPDMPNCDLPQYRDMVSPGGGFGPVSDCGYGVSYMIAGDFRIFFHVSSKYSTPDTDSNRFLAAIRQSLIDMKAIFDGPAE